MFSFFRTSPVGLNGNPSLLMSTSFFLGGLSKWKQHVFSLRNGEVVNGQFPGPPVVPFYRFFFGGRVPLLQ